MENEKYSLKKVLYYSVLGLIGVVAGGMLVKKIRNDIRKGREYGEEKEVVKEHQKEIDASRLTYPESAYKTYANRLFEIVDGVGSTDKSIFEVVTKMKNKDDWNKLVTEFGVKSGTKWYNSGFSGNMVKWLQTEVSDIKLLGNYLANLGVHDF